MQYNVLCLFDIFGTLTGLQSPDHQFIEEQYKLSQLVTQLLGLLTRDATLYPLLSSQGGLNKVLSSKYVCQTKNFNVINSVVGLISQFMRQDYMVNNNVYKNTFKQEYLGALAQ